MSRFFRTPKKAWPLWVLGILLWFSEPFIEHYHRFKILEREGLVLGDDRILIGVVYILVFVFSPVFFLFLWMFFRNYPGSLSLFLWRSDRPSTSWLWTFFIGCGVFICIESFINCALDVIFPYGIQWLLWIYWGLCLRSILIVKAPLRKGAF